MKPLKAATAGRHFVVSTVLRNIFASRRRCAPWVCSLTLSSCVVGGVGDGHRHFLVFFGRGRGTSLEEDGTVVVGTSTNYDNIS